MLEAWIQEVSEFMTFYNYKNLTNYLHRFKRSLPTSFAYFFFFFLWCRRLLADVHLVFWVVCMNVRVLLSYVLNRYLCRWWCGKEAYVVNGRFKVHVYECVHMCLHMCRCVCLCVFASQAIRCKRRSYDFPNGGVE